MLTERILRWYGDLHNFKYVIFRYFNVCGADMNGEIGDSKKPSSLLVQNAVRGAMGIEPFSYTCQEVDTPDKSPIRDYIDVEDLANAHYMAYEYLLKVDNKSDIFNLGQWGGLVGQGNCFKKLSKNSPKKWIKRTAKREKANMPRFTPTHQKLSRF